MINLDLWKKRKKELNLTFQDLAELSKIPKRTLEDIFAQRTPSPRIDTVQKIERALGITSWSEEEYKQGITPYAVRNLTVEEDEMLELYRELGDKKGQKAQTIVRKLIEEMLAN